MVEGDRLEGPAGPLVVQSLEKVPGVHRVYNMTVETEHVYRVSTLGALVHNNGCAQREKIVVNLGGEGEVLGRAINVQPTQIGNSAEEATQNAARVKAKADGQVVTTAPGNNLPFPSNSINEINLSSAPLDSCKGHFGESFTTDEIYRVLEPGGEFFRDGKLQ